MKEPKTLRDAIRYFSDEQMCIDAITKLRWPDGKPSCPSCAHKEHYWLASQKRWKCRKCGRQFSVKRGTIFEDSPLPLDKWLIALWMIVNCKNGISSYEVHRAIGITQKSAWFVLHRLRLALQSRSLVKLGAGGEVEVDETFIGGLARNMHPAKRKRRIHVHGVGDKTAVMGILERGGQVRAMPIPDTKRPTLHGEVKNNVASGTAIYTDYHPAYLGLDNLGFEHQMVDHAEKYVDGKIHTNGLENFWSLLKRGLGGTYIAVEPFHLFRYVDEQVFRYNNRAKKDRPMSDADRFRLALSQITGKRLTFSEVTGKVGGGPIN